MTMMAGKAGGPHAAGTSPRAPFAGEPGVLVVDKPGGVSSAVITARVKSVLALRKIGHTGTLDPFATGVLVLCLNEATRVADQFINLGKAYLASLRFGEETDTLDRTGTVVRTSGLVFSREDLVEAIDSFRGPCLQKVPRFSAVKVGGQRLYKLSRKGIEVEQPEREVCIHSIELRSFDWPEAVIAVSCSKGTYIRQLAADIGRKLGSGAHLSALRRVGVGPFDVESALSMDELWAQSPGSGFVPTAMARERVLRAIVPLNDALSHLPSTVVVEEQVLVMLRHGHLDPVWERSKAGGFSEYSGAVRIVTEAGRLAALWWPNAEGSGSRRLRVFPF
jgi:tRNA pseudouridine55 synthase